MQFLGNELKREDMPSYIDPTTLKDHLYMDIQDQLGKSFNIDPTGQSNQVLNGGQTVANMGSKEHPQSQWG